MRFILSFALFISMAISAKEIKLVDIINNDPRDNSTYEMLVEVSEHNEIIAFHKDEFFNSRKIKRSSYKLNSIEDGFVLDRKKGRDVIKLLSDTFDSFDGGALELKYLYSGITGKYKSKKIQIISTDNSWALKTGQGVKIKLIDIRVNKNIILGIIGVKEILLR